MGVLLLKVVEKIRKESLGLPAIDLARLNLRVGKALSRAALDIPDDPEIVALAQRVAEEILAEHRGRQ